MVKWLVFPRIRPMRLRLVKEPFNHPETDPAGNSGPRIASGVIEK
jgi:hypothetical protein